MFGQIDLNLGRHILWSSTVNFTSLVHVVRICHSSFEGSKYSKTLRGLTPLFFLACGCLTYLGKLRLNKKDIHLYCYITTVFSVTRPFLADEAMCVV